MLKTPRVWNTRVERYNVWNNQRLCFFFSEGTCDDVAIIGAGVAGTYAGWRLRNQLKKITIYEFSSRVGGRMYTKRFPDIPDINIELGAMRFYPESKLKNYILSLAWLKYMST